MKMTSHHLVACYLLAGGTLFSAAAQTKEQQTAGLATIDSKLELDRIVLDPWPDTLVRGSRNQEPPSWRCLGGDDPDFGRRVSWRTGVYIKDTASIAGPKVRRILVKQYSDRTVSGKERNWSELQKEVQRVWSSPLGDLNSPWAEPVFWDVEAVVEFDKDRRKACLVTEGFHVSLADVNGRNWYWRIPPTK